MIKHFGYYSFHHVIYCSYYSRLATNQGQCLLTQHELVKSSNGFEKIQLPVCQDDLNVVTWGWIKTASFFISCCFTTKWYIDGLQICFLTLLFQWLHKSLALRVSRNAKLFWTVFGIATWPIMYSPFFKLTVKWSLSFTSRGCSCAQIIAAATKQRWHLFCSALPKVRLLFEGSHKSTAVFNLWNMVHSITVQFIAVLPPISIPCWGHC